MVRRSRRPRVMVLFPFGRENPCDRVAAVTVHLPSQSRGPHPAPRCIDYPAHAAASLRNRRSGHDGPRRTSCTDTWLPTCRRGTSGMSLKETEARGRGSPIRSESREQANPPLNVVFARGSGAFRGDRSQLQKRQMIAFVLDFIRAEKELFQARHTLGTGYARRSVRYCRIRRSISRKRSTFTRASRSVASALRCSASLPASGESAQMVAMPGILPLPSSRSRQLLKS
jgi:hypothetical protein